MAPTTGHPGSVLRFTFRLQSAAVVPERMQTSAELSVAGPAGSGCVATHTAGVPGPAVGRSDTVSLGPAQLGGRWCAGTYQARVVEVARPRCGPAQMCPQFIRVLGTIGSVRFQITP